MEPRRDEDETQRGEGAADGAAPADATQAGQGPGADAPASERDAAAKQGSEPKAGGEPEAHEGRAEAEAGGEPSGEGASGQDELIADLRRERDEYLSLAQRTRADFENFRRRAAREASEAERRGKAELVRALLPALDSLERALVAAGVQPDGAQEGADEGEPRSREVSAHEALAEGVALVHRELTAALEGAGIERFDPLGERFDPNTCEALSTRPAADGESNGVVVETLQRGYRIGELLIRPARVVVTG